MEEIKEITELEKLENKSEELRKAPEKYRIESKVEPIFGAELEEYIKLTDEEKQEKYSKEKQDATDKYIQLLEKTNEQEDEIIKQTHTKAIEAYKAVASEIERVENDIEENDKVVATLDEQINELKEQIAQKEQALEQMETSENYDQDEYEKLLKEIEGLKNNLTQKEREKEDKIKANEKNKEQLESLKAKKQQLIDKYKVVEYQIELDNTSKQWNEIYSRRNDKYKEYKALKKTEGYKNKDEETLNKVNQLAKEIIEADNDRNKIAEEQKKLRENIDELTGRETLKVVRKEDVESIDKDDNSVTDELVEPAPDSEQGQNNKADTTETVEDKGKKDTTATNGKKKDQGRAQVATVIPETTEIVKKEEDKKEIDPQEEFDGLCYKAKSGNLKDEEFDRLVEIMKEPTSYDKLGITTGKIFNKSRGIFKALEKHIGNIDGLSSEVKEQFAKELVGDSDGKELLTKVAELDKEGLTVAQQATFEKVKSTLNRQESLEQAKYVRDKIALEKVQKHWFWSWFLEYDDEIERLGQAKTNKTEKTDKEDKPKAGEIKELSELKKSEKEQNEYNNSYEAPKNQEVAIEGKEQE